MSLKTDILLKLSNIADGLITLAKINSSDLIKIDNKLTFNSQTGNYTLVLDDQYKTILTSGAGNVDITIPQNSSVAFEIGSSIAVIAIGTGVVKFVAGSGATVNGIDGLTLDGQYSVASVIKVDTNSWVATGRLKT